MLRDSPTAGRQHQRQAHRGHLAADDAVGTDRGCGRHRIPDRRADGQVPVHRSKRHCRERARDSASPKLRSSVGGSRCCWGSRRGSAAPKSRRDRDPVFARDTNPLQGGFGALVSRGVALDRRVHLGGGPNFGSPTRGLCALGGGNDARPHGSVDLREDRPSARAEGERDDGTIESRCRCGVTATGQDDFDLNRDGVSMYFASGVGVDPFRSLITRTAWIARQHDHLCLGESTKRRQFRIDFQNYARADRNATPHAKVDVSSGA
jgi:hypothetical protein